MNVIVVIAVILALITLGFFTKRDIGYLSVFSAMVCGLLLADMNLSRIISLLPLNTIFNIIIITIFFGYAVENGTAQVLINNMLTSVSARMVWFPLTVFLISAVMAGSGLGAGNASMLLAPLAFMVGIKANISPLILGMAVSCGTTIGSNLPFSYGGILFTSLVEAQAYQRGLSSLAGSAALYGAAIFTLSFLLLFLVKKKTSTASFADISAQTELDPRQKKTLFLVAGVIVAIVVPSVADALFPCPFWDTAARFLDLRVVLGAGICIASFLKLADDDIVLRKCPPWRLIVLVSGMSMLVGIGKELGVTTMLANMLTTHFAADELLYAIAVISMLMSLFASAMAIVLPTLIPMVTAVAATAGIDPGPLYIALFMGASCGGISPFSSGGMVILGNSTLEGKARNTLFYQLIGIPFLEITVCCIILFLGNKLGCL